MTLPPIIIPPDVGGKLEKLVLSFEDEQDEYIEIDFTGNLVNSVMFYM